MTIGCISFLAVLRVKASRWRGERRERASGFSRNGKAVQDFIDPFYQNESCKSRQADVAMFRCEKMQGESAGIQEDFRSKGKKGCVIKSTPVVMLRAHGAAMALTSATADKCSARQHVKHSMGGADALKSEAAELIASAHIVAADETIQVSAASAAIGASGGATGLAAGGALGAVVGVVPAHVTFGLSIPIGAAIGGGAGLVCGTAIGWTVSAIGGGEASYSLGSRKDDMGKS